MRPGEDRSIRKKLPLDVLIESIEEVLGNEDDYHPMMSIGRNPFNSEPRYRFNPELDYKHDIKLLKYQLGALREISAGLDQFF